MDSQLYLGDHDQTKYYEQTCLKQKTFKVRKEKIIVHENYVYEEDNNGDFIRQGKLPI